MCGFSRPPRPRAMIFGNNYLAYGALMLIMTAVLMIMLLSYERGHALLVGPLTMAVSAAAAMWLSGRWRRLPAAALRGLAKSGSPASSR